MNQTCKICNYTTYKYGLLEHILESHYGLSKSEVLASENDKYQKYQDEIFRLKSNLADIRRALGVSYKSQEETIQAIVDLRGGDTIPERELYNLENKNRRQLLDLIEASFRMLEKRLSD